MTSVPAKASLAAASRRRIMLGLAAAPLAASRVGPVAAASGARVRPDTPGWPTRSQWAQLGEAVGGRLEPCARPVLSESEAKAAFANQFWLRDQPAYTQISGWIDAWRSAPSAWVVKAASAADVSAAVRFAAAHRLRLVVRGGGHSYMGGSSAPDSLLVWLRPMDGITLHDAFVPVGSGATPVPAVSLGGGCIWLHAYQAVTGAAGRYVQGGGCTTVGVGGLVQGGGFGSFSKRYGTSAASLIEAEIVTADGAVRVVNAARDADLFWAIKGGGGGTFGVVTRFTLRTHDLPATFGVARWVVQAHSDEAYRVLLRRFLETYAAELFDDHWGEQARAEADNQLHIEMVFQDLDAAAAHAAWASLTAFVRDHPADYATVSPFLAVPVPARLFWDAGFIGRTAPDAITRDSRPGAKSTDFCWTGDAEQAAGVWLGYASAWLPRGLLFGDGPGRLADAWFEASRHRSVALHFNKGLAGGSKPAIEASRETATNPQVLEAFALAITGGLGPTAYGPFTGPDPVAAREAARSIGLADAALRKVAPQAGSYVSECDYFMPDWQARAWGGHYPRLARIKRRYDPQGLFIVHHGVGSEDWPTGGVSRA